MNERDFNRTVQSCSRILPQYSKYKTTTITELQKMLNALYQVCLGLILFIHE